MVWRRGIGDTPPDPFPSRVEAFMTACAMHAGQRERDLYNIVEGFGKGMEKARQDPRGR